MVTNSSPVDLRRWWRNDNPFPTKSFFRAACISHLAVAVIWESVTLGSPDIAVLSVIKWARSTTNIPVPADSLCLAFRVPDSAVLVSVLIWTNVAVFVANPINI